MSTITTTATISAIAPPEFIARPGGKLDYVTFTIPHSHHPNLLSQICSAVNYEILSGEPRLCRDVRAQVVRTPQGEYITVSNLHDNHKRYFDALFTTDDSGKVAPNDFFEVLLVETERGMAALAQQLTQNRLVTVYRSSDWLHV
ncbi:hypothetical protein B0I73DRAFT_134118 [Yarrowia lipolytica]|uniref:YALI0C01089p n=1 Tax=Yarrowia lipolytica (strain CLIB 122 / E 150) TaxID=284591 RepID=Q6CDE8_YARLI|nr:YALI0C01089p [Yarrowia lipolytica CLIB122]KAB8283602.1 hypothetical protein BKA91DRAFT_136638 [Yarrowia lipolytica]KAE8170990.1 hypothetical protein BKA90DRAFT_139760 [Yarrowia lipolytica]KAJ8052932.1 hypothetical protein LXG23DRAFT_22384 [Yarrowia lipolytica]QNP96372.1 Hypothetical protein YALI2_C00025g [Yarrowia lipolytica]RDW38255.1 hypothetical protein B0I73DRAFT_134118 [Yarrowia lipolytica]|eukprot:XP_501314.2 YALI0C01089p [Yarrowia lipolytica CLIB122]